MAQFPKILIITISQDQQSTEVMEWLISEGAECIRFNTDWPAESYDQHFLNASFSGLISNTQHSNFDAVWIRKPRRITSFPIPKEIKVKESYSKWLPQKASRNIEKEYLALEEFMLLGYGAKRILGNLKNSEPNKYEVLVVAKHLGLNVPETLVTNSKYKLLAFKKEHQDIVSKLNHVLACPSNDGSEMLHSYTEKITDEFIVSLPDQFFMASFQKEIMKRLEIRSFYLDGHFYSIGMFTQQSQRTKVDSRRYDYSQPIRRVPYKLPEAIEKALTKLMQYLSLNTGSIDIIKSLDGKYYFLEVNPVGQFGQTSEVGNYNLPQKVAAYLLKGDAEA